ncbi:MAG: leucine-rich repeat protein, partial [Phocaeicola sp.]
SRLTSIGKSAFAAASDGGTITGLSFVADGADALSIGEEAFINQKITTVKVPSRLTSIGKSAFAAASDGGTITGLSFVADGPDALSIGEEAFIHQKITSLEMPSRLSSIGKSAFAAASDAGTITGLSFVVEVEGKDLSIGDSSFVNQKLTELTIPRRVKSIGSDAFKDISTLASVFIPKEVVTVGVDAFTGIVEEESTIVTDYTAKPSTWDENWNNKKDNVSWGGCLEYSLVGNSYHVVGKGSLVESAIVIPDTYRSLPVIEIKAEAFKDDAITSVTIGKNIVNIGERSFEAGEDAGTLTTLTFVSDGTEDLVIGKEAFKNQKIKQVSIPNRAISIDDQAFVNNKELSTLTFEEEGANTLQIGESAFGEHKLAELIIPNRITSLGNNAFYSTTNGGTLTKLTFEENRTSDLIIESGVFKGQKLTSLTFSENIISIGDEAFKENASLAHVFIPLDVTTIGEDAFTGIQTAKDTIVTDYMEKPENWHENWNGNVENVKWTEAQLAYELKNNIEYHVVGRGDVKGSSIVVPN